MNKIREEFDKVFNSDGWKRDKDRYLSNHYNSFEKGYKSRDKEIHKYEQIATENSDWFDALKIDFDKQKEEKEEIEKQKAIMRNIINLKNKKIKKLNRLTDTLLSTMVEFGIKQAEEVQKTLEETDA